MATYLDNFQHQSLILLMADSMFHQHLVNHRDEDLVFLAQLEDEGGKGIHGDDTQLGGGV